MSPELAAKIRALRERTVARGCTEAEAMAAAELLRQLLEKYGVSLEELEDIRARSARPDTTFAGVKRRGRENRYAFAAELAVAGFFDVIYVGPRSAAYQDVAHLGAPVFFGLSSDVAAAIALTEIVHHALGEAWTIYREANPPASPDDAAVMRRSFQCAMSGRIDQRLWAMRRTYKAARNALVVVKSELVLRAAADAGVIGIEGGAWPEGTKWDAAAMRAGAAAGDHVSLGAAERIEADARAAAAHAESERRKEPVEIVAQRQRSAARAALDAAHARFIESQRAARRGGLVHDPLPGAGIGPRPAPGSVRDWEERRRAEVDARRAAFLAAQSAGRSSVLGRVRSLLIPISLLVVVLFAVL